MNKELEAVSGLIDDDTSQLNEAIDVLLSDVDARSLWGASHDFRHVISEPKAVVASAGFAQAIADKVAQEPSLLVHANVDVKPRKNAKILTFLKPVAGLSIAATVATLAVFGVGDHVTPNPSALGVTVASAPEPSTPIPTTVLNTHLTHADVVPVTFPVTFTGEYDHRTYWEGSDKTTSEELNRYLTTHLEHANPGGFQSVMPYARVVGYDDE